MAFDFKGNRVFNGSMWRQFLNPTRELNIFANTFSGGKKLFILLLYTSIFIADN